MPYKIIASVAELVDALDSKSSSLESVGSIATRGTNIFETNYIQMIWIYYMYI